jgi:hypothetical protein
MWGLLLSIFTWLFKSMLPMITATLRPILAPTALKCYAIWTTNSLAGAKTRAKKEVGLNNLQKVLVKKTLKNGQCKGKSLTTTGFGQSDDVFAL